MTRMVPKSMEKWWPTLSAIEMLELSSQMVEKGIDRIKKVGTVE